MRRVVLLLLTVICHSTTWAGSPVHVILAAGQSNTDGRVCNRNLPGYIKTLATDTVSFSEGAYRYCKIAQNRTDGQFIPFWPKCTKRDNLNRWGYDAVTYYWLEQLLQRDFYVIKWAVGGTSIAHRENVERGSYWSANADWIARNTSTAQGGHSLLLSFIQEIDACIDQTLSRLRDGYQIDAFLWHQGEADYRRGEQYYQNLKDVVNYVRHHLSIKTGKDYSRLPFILGTIPHHNKSYSSLVEAGMKRLAKEDEHVYVIDMSKAELQSDKLHFTETAAEQLGKQMYEHINSFLIRN